MSELLDDPRPNETDSPLWDKLLRGAAELPDKRKAQVLNRRLWTMRSVGTVLFQTKKGHKFMPLLPPMGTWESEAEFDEIKRKYLLPYAEEIQQLFASLN